MLQPDQVCRLAHHVKDALARHPVAEEGRDEEGLRQDGDWEIDLAAAVTDDTGLPRYDEIISDEDDNDLLDILIEYFDK